MTFIFRCFSISILVILLLSCTQEAPQKKQKAKAIHLVEAVPVTKEDIAIIRTRTGSLRARHEVKIFNQEEGRIISLPFFEGDKVKKGEIVARLDDKLLRAQLARAQATRHNASEDIKRMRDLYKKNLASAEELSRSETEYEIAKADEDILKTRLSYTSIAAPFDGVVSRRLTEPGNIAERYSHLLTLSDMTSLMTEVSVSELLLPKLSVDDKIQARIDALGNNTFEGHILRIHPSLDPTTRMGTVEVELKPVPKGAVPGQLCRVQFNTQNIPRLLLPFRALRQDTQGEYVFIFDENSKAQRLNIISGPRIAENVVILDESIQEGQLVITKGFLSLKSGTKVQQVNAPESISNE